MQAAASQDLETQIMHADSTSNEIEAAIVAASSSNDEKKNQDAATGKAGLSSRTGMFPCMMLHLYKAAAEGKIDTFRPRAESLDQLLTPNKNTILHIHITALSTEPEATDFVVEILNQCPSLLLQVNVKGETPLHIAARYGHARIVKVLIERAKALHQDLEMGIGEAREMLRMPNNERDTALHEAVRNNHLDGVKIILTEEDPEFLYSANKAEETPLYLAAERGYDQMVAEILRTCKSPAHSGPNGRTALHAAVIGGNEDITRMILERKGTLTKEVDRQGWTPLHYAAHFDYTGIACQLLKSDVSAAYYADNGGKKTPLHLAARRGFYNTMEQIMNFSLDCCEFVEEKGRNILHLAVQSNSNQAIRIVLQNPSLNHLLNEKDVDGNTPLHLLAASGFYLPELIHHPKVDKMACNGRNLTALDIIEADDKFFEMKKAIIQKLKFRGSKRVWRNAICNDIDSGNENEGEELISDVEKAKESHLIVAALIATVTFTAGFTLPGGFISDKGPNQGSASLTRNSAFKVFVIFDTIAMVFSTSAVFFHFFMALQKDKRRIFWYFLIAFDLTMFSMGAMVLAFVTGTYAVLEHSAGLASATCVIGLSFFFFFFILLNKGILKPRKFCSINKV